MTTSTRCKLNSVILCFVITSQLLLLASQVCECAQRRDYHYTRTRRHPNHLRISEDLKNQYVDEVKLESKINGTIFEYYRSSLAMNYDELVFETIDKMYRHRLSPFYIHHYDNEQDKKTSSDPGRVSQEACARDLMYLVDKLPQKKSQSYMYGEDNEHLTPELSAFFDSYARQEAGLLMGNTFWVGAHDQCVKRQIFELIDASQQASSSSNSRHKPSTSENQFSSDEHQQAVSFNGRYCIASLKAPIWNKLIEAKKSKARNYFKSERQLQIYAQLFRLQMGICLPDSCDSSALERHRDEIKLLTNTMLSESRFNHYDLVDLYCLPDENSPLRQLSSSTVNFLILLGLWLTLVSLATLADIFELFPAAPRNEKVGGFDAEKDDPKKRVRRSRLPLVVQCFSLRANYRKLMHVNLGTHEKTDSQKQAIQGVHQSSNKHDISPTSPNAGQLQQHSQQVCTDGEESEAQSQQNEQPKDLNLRFLNAFKVLIMFWVINGHIMLLMIQTAKNILNSDALLNELMHFLIGATFGVDLFFTMTGLITSYLIFSSGHAYKMKPSTWIYLSFHRYWRLAPMYLLSFWFSRSVMQSLGSGPLWDYGTSDITFRGLCNTESWWYPLTLTSNLHGLFEECIITSWYISCDMQFWLISPIFIHLLAKSPFQGWFVSLLTIAASSKARYDAILNDKSARYDELVQPRADIFMRVSHDLPALYTHPQFRVSAYIVGLLAGHYVYMTTSPKATSITKMTITQGTNIETTTTASMPEIKAGHRVRLEPLKGRARSALAYTGLAIFIIMAFVSYLLANYFPSSLLHQARPLSALAYSIDHLIMSVGASLVIVSICMGQWPSVERFLSHPNWTRLSKLNYALLLLQCEAIYYQIFRYEQVPLAGTRELINILFNLIVTLYPLAFLVTLVFEFPLANLEKLL